MRNFIIVMSVVFCLGLSLFAADRITGRMFATRSEVLGQNGMVASSHPLATQIGLDILKKGGTAVDAAIAVNAALGLMEPTSCGIGGDLFAMVWEAKTGKLYGLNASGTAPKRISLDYFRKNNLSRVPYYGPLSWTVPGAPDGWFELHKKFGKLDMKTILTPSIEYAEKGFPVTELIAHYWQSSVQKFKEYENFQKLYAPGGKAPQKGDIFKNPELAATYRLLAEKGREVFYTGEIARRLDAYSQRVGGFLRYDDLAEFHPEWVQPLSVNYKGYDVWELPPNGQGLAVLQMLNMLKTMDIKSLGHNTAEYLHALIEVKKLAYEDRARFYADPRFVLLPVATLLSDAYAEKRMKLFSSEKANRKIPLDESLLSHSDTIYLTVVDKDWNAVSLIQSNYSGFGSGNVPDGLGFCIQDRGTLFSLEEGHPNVIAPGKRPFHTIIPGMASRNGKPVFTFGVMGGGMQPQGHVQVLLNILEFGMNIQEAGDAARFCHEGSSEPDEGKMTDGGTVYLESGVSPEAVRGLLGRGHAVSWTRGIYGGYQGIWLDHERHILIGASESRKDGCAAGY